MGKSRCGSNLKNEKKNFDISIMKIDGTQSDPLITITIEDLEDLDHMIRQQTVSNLNTRSWQMSVLNMVHCQSSFSTTLSCRLQTTNLVNFTSLIDAADLVSLLSSYPERID